MKKKPPQSRSSSNATTWSKPEAMGLMYAIGVDLGGTKTAAGVVSDAGEVLFTETIPTLNRDGGEAILDATASLVTRLMARAAGAGIVVEDVGVGSAGHIDASSGVVVSATDAI